MQSKNQHMGFSLGFFLFLAGGFALHKQLWGHVGGWQGHPRGLGSHLGGHLEGLEGHFGRLGRASSHLGKIMVQTLEAILWPRGLL